MIHLASMAGRAHVHTYSPSYCSCLQFIVFAGGCFGDDGFHGHYHGHDYDDSSSAAAAAAAASSSSGTAKLQQAQRNHLESHSLCMLELASLCETDPCH